MIYLASLGEEIDDKLSRYTIVHTREDVAKIICDDAHANTIIFRSDFITKYFTPTGFQQYIDGARQMNPSLIINVDDKIEFNSVDVMTRKIHNARSIDDVILLMNRYPKEFLDTLHNITGDIEDKNQKFLSNSTQISQLQNQINSLVDEKEDIKIKLGLKTAENESIRSRLDVLVSRINYQYGLNYNADKTFTTDGHSYDKVLYIKEITRVQYVDTFLHYLQEILRVVYGMPTRVVVIESYYADSKVMQYPHYKPHYDLTQEDVLSGDVLMLGMQPKLMNDILRNASNVSFLIILDRAGYSEPHVTGDNVEYLFTVSDLKDCPGEIDRMRTISYSPDTLSIPFIDGFGKMDSSQQMSAYSSFPIMKSIIDLINSGVN